jgi:hypothetical protein
MKVKKVRLVAALLAAATVAAACATTIPGSAQPVPGQAPVKVAADPCTLLNAARRPPPSCGWTPAGGTSTVDMLTVTWSEDMSLNTYLDGAQPGEKFQLGGFSWARYPSTFGTSFCSLATKLAGNSFVSVFSSDNKDESKSCDVAKAAAPLVASHLPGGAPAPSVLPTATASSSVAPEPSGPLVSVEPCSLLKPDQVAAHKLDSRTDTLGKASDPQRPPGCEWHDTDGARGQKSLDVYVAAARPAKRWPLMDVAGEPFDAAGK